MGSRRRSTVGLVWVLGAAAVAAGLVVAGLLLGVLAHPGVVPADRAAAEAERAADASLARALSRAPERDRAAAAEAFALAAATAPPRPEGRAGRVGFIVPFMVLLVAVALLAALVVGRGLARDLRRVEQALRGLADAGRPVGEAERPADADPGDELALLAWTAGRLGERCAADLERYRDARSAETRVRRSKLDFLAVMSHELRTPLNTILGFAELLLEGLEGDVTPGQREDLRIVRHSGEHLLSLVNDILDLSALRSGQMTPLLETVDLAGLGHQVLDEAEAQVHGRPVHLATEFGEEPLVVQADRRMIWRVLHNLVGNALKFTNRGEVRLRLRRDGDVAVIEVCDTGAGMSPESLAMIFEEYRQAGDARAKREGAGLGLAIARRLLELHGGTVTAESEPGRGSTFTVRLPVSGPAAAVAATSGTPPTAPRAAGEAGDG